MHIPDGLMDPWVFIVGWALALAALAVALVKVNKNVDERTIPLMALLAAGIFVAQMLNFPVGGGTSGHLIGAALAVALVGLWPAMIIMTAIVVIQGLLFGDGGITAMGLNLLNMAVIAPLVAYLIISVAKGNKFSVPVAAWASVFVAALICAAQLALSYVISNGAYGIDPVLAIPTMAIWHAVIGVGEAIITGGVVLYLAKVAPETLRLSPKNVIKATEA